MTAKQTILASGSSSRRAMLSAAGIVFSAIAPEFDEASLTEKLRREGKDGEDIAMALAEGKALTISGRYPGAIVIGGDQILDCAGRLFSKAASLEEAKTTLLALRGREHRLISAAVLAGNGKILWRGSDSATLSMRAFSDVFLESYLDREVPDILGSVGCYRIEGRGAQLFGKVTGDQFCIRGMPLFAVLAALRAQGALDE
jgi:septum formation protein